MKMFGMLSEQNTAVGTWAPSFSFPRAQTVEARYSHDLPQSDSEEAVTFGMFEPWTFDAKGGEDHISEAAESGYPN